jgi:septin 3/9/12
VGNTRKSCLALKNAQSGCISLVENESHCEFVPLRDFLMRTHLQELIDVTATFHYENFRTKQLLALKESSAAVTQR